MRARLFSPKPTWIGLVPFLAVAWVVFLRAPGFSVPLWNVDEGIHAAVAQRMLHGGLLYRDAIDQRTPVSYYFFEAVFVLFGANKLAAVRALVAVMIGLTAAGLFSLANRAAARATRWWALLIFIALSTNLLDPADANAANTEWFAIFFTTFGACGLWLALERTSKWLAFLSGVSFALGFLSKQPALLDALPPLVVIAYGTWTKAWSRAAGLRSALFYIVGFAAMIVATVAHFAARGGLAPAIFYTWSYNLHYYGPEISPLDRALTLFVPFRLLAHAYPGLLIVSIAAVLVAAARLVQFAPDPTQQKKNPWVLFVLLWFITSLAGAVAGGRGFEHYYIQWLPAASLLMAWLLGDVFQAVIGHLKARRTAPRVSSWAIGILLAVAAAHLLVQPIAARHAPAPPEDPALRASAFVRSHTTADETIFVWGYNPDIYLYARRSPASRFVYCSFLTGLIPWTNLSPEKDTRYAIVPGAMDELLDDLRRARPTFIVDCSPGPHRRFQKYPISDFAPLRDYLAENYVEVESAQFVPQGFRLHLIKDSAQARRSLPTVATGSATSPSSRIFAETNVGPTPTRVVVTGEDSNGQLQGLELWVDDRRLDAVSLLPTPRITLGFLVPYDRLGVGLHRLKAVARGPGGATVESPTVTVTCETSAITPEKLPVFSIPLSGGMVKPITVRAPFGPSSGWEDGRHVYSLHATSSLVFPLNNVERVQGEFGIRAGAYAAENKAPTDGAEFSVAWIGAAGERQILFRRTLRPREEAADRGAQAFSIELPAALRNGRIEFGIDPGPAGNAASDWTYWSNLLLHASR